jgi:FkbM family methyltransferase
MNKKLLAALKSKSHYSSELPYNLNWGINLTPEVKEYLIANPIVVTDVGCRGGMTGELEAFVPYSKLFAFDADPNECDRLNQTAHDHVERKIFPYFVGGKNGVASFNLFINRAQSSIFNSDERFCHLFRNANDFYVEKTVEVEARTLDYIFETEQLPPSDFLKLDTQGSELDILQAAPKVISKVTMIEVEIEFTRIYEKQPLFFEVAEFLYSQGFELLYLNRVFEQRSAVYAEPTRGQLLFGDALFGRREDTLADFDTARLVVYALLLINFGHTDIAFDLTRRFPSIATALPGISRFFRTSEGWSFGRKVMRRVGREIRPQLDKLILLLLHLRRSNHLTYDSDRNWPVR